MTSTPDPVVGTYNAVTAVIERANTDQLKAFPLVFLQRLSLLCIAKGVLQTDAHEANLTSYLSVIANPDNAAMKQYADAAQTRAEETGAEEETIEVGYFTILCYAHSFLLTQETRYVKYTCDVYLSWLETELADDGEGALATELANTERLVSRVSSQADWTPEALRDLCTWAMIDRMGA